MKTIILPGYSPRNREWADDLAAVLAPERILVVQNRADPYASCAEVEKIVQSLAPGIRVTEGDRDDHHYPYHEIFTAFLET